MTAPTQKQARRWGRITRRFMILTAIAFVVLVVCPMFFWLFEHSRSPEIRHPGTAYQWLGRTLFESSSAYKIKTLGGFITYYTVRVAGVSLVAFTTATISSRLISIVILKGKGMGSSKANGHIVICGWSSKGPEIIKELKAEEVDESRHILVIANTVDDPTKDDAIEFIHGDPCDSDDLERAGIATCDTAIILADESSTSATDGERDANTLLTCLAVESLNPSCYTCVEVIRSENKQHFLRTQANELVVSAELTGALLAGSARTHGLSRLVGDLVTHPTGSEFHRMAIPPELVGRSVKEVLQPLKETYDAMLVAVMADGHYLVNPRADQVINEGDELLVVSGQPNPAA